LPIDLIISLFNVAEPIEADEDKEENKY